MAKSEPTPAPERNKVFEHGGRYVTVLIPANSKHADFTRRHLSEKYGPDAPPLTNAIKVAEISQDSIVYVAHPVRIKRKVKNRAGEDVWKNDLDLFLSRPVDIGAECVDTPRRGARILDFNKMCQVLNTVTKNDPAGWFFSPFLSGFNKADFSEATIQLMNR